MPAAINWASIFPNDYLFKVIAAVVELIIGMLIAPMVKSWIMKMKPIGMDQGVLTFAGSTAGITVRVITVIIALGQLGVKMDILVGAISALGLGISLALKESMANVAGGLQILITRPFKIGDYIEVSPPNGIGGTVKEIELMFTTLQTPNLQKVVIPNSTMVSQNLIDYSEFPNRRIVVSVPVSMNGDYESFRTRMVDILNNTPKILKDPKPMSAVSGFTTDGNGMTINLVCYCRGSDYWDMLYYVNEQAQILLKETGLSQPVNRVEVNRMDQESETEQKKS